MINKSNILSYIIIFLLIISIYTLLIMVIWNNVLLKKIKGLDLQKIDFWDALAISVFFSIVNCSTFINHSDKPLSNSI